MLGVSLLFGPFPGGWLPNGFPFKPSKTGSASQFETSDSATAPSPGAPLARRPAWGPGLKRSLWRWDPASWVFFPAANQFSVAKSAATSVTFSGLIRKTHELRQKAKVLISKQNAPKNWLFGLNRVKWRSNNRLGLKKNTTKTTVGTRPHMPSLVKGQGGEVPIKSQVSSIQNLQTIHRRYPKKNAKDRKGRP